MTKIVVGVETLAEMLETTTASIRSNLYRKNYSAIPMPLRLGKRVVWSLKQIEAFLASKENAALNDDSQ